MTTRYWQMWSHHCGRKRLFRRQKYSLAADLVLLVFTRLLWVIVMLVRPVPAENMIRGRTCRRKVRP